MLEWLKELFVKNEGPPGPFTAAEIEYYLLAVFSGIITKNNLSQEYHFKVAEHLMDAVRAGFGDDLKDLTFLSKRYQSLMQLRSNIYVFSAAKQYSQVWEMSAFINQKGVKSTFKEFRETADRIFETYNKNYLRTEYNTAIGQAQSASQWVQIQEQKKTLPMIKYHTQKDARVRDEHAILDGIVRPVDDKFWDQFMPKNGWGCRCFVTQHTEEEKETDLEKRTLPEFGDKNFPKVFRMNPGKDGIIFNPKFHPYFRVAPGDAEFKANNYNLPIL